MVSFEFLTDKILPAALWLWGRLRNEYQQYQQYQQYFLVRKGGQCVGLTTLSHSYADCHEIWEPQTPGTLRDCPDL